MSAVMQKVLEGLAQLRRETASAMEAQLEAEPERNLPGTYLIQQLADIEVCISAVKAVLEEG